MRGGKAEKEMKGAGESERERGEGGERLSFIQRCVSYSLVWKARRKEGGSDGGVERDRLGRKERKLKTLPLC